MERDLTRPSTLKEVLGRHGIGLSKRFGQHFLTDRNHLLKVVAAAAPQPGEVVLEVGPGAGVLTVELAATGAEVVAIELDRKLLPVLRETLEGADHVTIVEGDALQVEFGAVLPAGKSAKVAANIPYNVTSPLLVRFLEHDPSFVSLTLMVQKEVAERLRARPGTADYGALSVFVQFYATVSLVAVVPRGAFFPAPAVDSAIIHLIPHAVPPVEVPSAAAFFKVTRAAFGQRRKTLGNALASGLNLPRDRVNAALERASIDPQRRGETLSLQEFAAVARAFAEPESAG